jgi:hypothetical protein
MEDASVEELDIFEPLTDAEKAALKRFCDRTGVTMVTRTLDEIFEDNI